MMDTNPRRKLVVSAITAVLLLSSILFLDDAEADANDLIVSNLEEPAGTPPPRANVDYTFMVEWSNEGDTSEDATVRLYADCDRNSGSDYNESETITMGAGQSGIVNLSITFTSTGETCYSATIHQSSSEAFENFVNVEPETGDADLWVDLNMTKEQAAPGEPVPVEFFFGNDGEVTTLNPVSIMAFFDPVGNTEANYFAPSPFVFEYMSPPEDSMAPDEFMEWDLVVPEGTCDLGPRVNETVCEDDGGVWTTSDGRLHTITIVIDSDGNNTAEDPDSDNNIDTWEICIGDCELPDLHVAEEGTGEDSILSQPLEPVAGRVISFTYGLANTGAGNADCPPAGPNCPGAEGDLVTHLEVQKCAGEGEDPCAGSPWEYKNTSKVVRTPIAKCCENNVLYDENILRLNWSTSASDAGLWNVRIFVDANNVIEEIDENNNYLDWNKVHNGYFNLLEQRPDLMVSAIDPGASVVYKGDEQNIKIQVVQSEFGDAMAENVELYLKIVEPDGTVIDWFALNEKWTVGFAPDMTTFEYSWEPDKLGTYEFSAWVDRGDIDSDADYNGGDILEWNEDNNKLATPKYIFVEPKLPDLKITSVTVSPLSDSGYAMVGVSSELTATLTNEGVRALNASEGKKLAITFYIAAPITTQLGKIYINEYCSCDATLNISESIDVTIPIMFALNDNYRLAAIVDEGPTPSSPGNIVEVSETNNQNFLNIYAASSVDAYVANLSVDVGDGLAGKERLVTFDVGMANLAEGQTYRLYFNISVAGHGDYGVLQSLAIKNNTGSYPIGTGYQTSGLTGFVDFNTSYLSSTISFPWVPEASESDTYNISVTVESLINVNRSNDLAYINKISMEKLTADVVVDAIKVTESGGSATIRVTVGYPKGVEPMLPLVDVGLEVYKASDYDEGNDPMAILTIKNITNLNKGDSRAVSFTWAVKDGDYIFVAVLDPWDKIKEIDEENNRYPSKLVTFGDSGPAVTEEEEDEGLLPAPSLVSSFVLLGTIALLRRRR